jgi:hypothetical protein
MSVEGTCICGGVVYSSGSGRDTKEVCEKCGLPTVRSVAPNSGKPMYYFDRLMPMWPDQSLWKVK